MRFSGKDDPNVKRAFEEYVAVVFETDRLDGITIGPGLASVDTEAFIRWLCKERSRLQHEIQRIQRNDAGRVEMDIDFSGKDE